MAYETSTGLGKAKTADDLFKLLSNIAENDRKNMTLAVIDNANLHEKVQFVDLKNVNNFGNERHRFVISRSHT